MNNPAARTVPRFIPFVIILLLGSMYYYAAFVDTPDAEKTVQKFYQAYFDQDFETVSQNLSVFWSVRFLPQYSSMSPAELLENRGTIEKETSQVIAEIESKNEIPQNIGIEIMPSYTKEGEYSALVAYTFQENGQPSGMELAILINEKGRYRIFTMSPIGPQDLEQIKNSDFNELEDNFKNLLSQ